MAVSLVNPTAPSGGAKSMLKTAGGDALKVAYTFGVSAAAVLGVMYLWKTHVKPRLGGAADALLDENGTMLGA